jgi:hypothetical protein
MDRVLPDFSHVKREAGSDQQGQGWCLPDARPLRQFRPIKL